MHFTCIILINPHNNPKREVYFPHFTDEKIEEQEG